MDIPGDDAVMPFLLIGAFRALVDEVHARLAAEGFPGVRATHGFALQAIGAGCTSVELGRRLGVTKQAAAKTVRSLQDMGLVERTENSLDRREQLVALTPRGRELLRVSGAAFREAVARWRREVGDDAVDATLATLGAVPAPTRGAFDLSDWQ